MNFGFEVTPHKIIQSQNSGKWEKHWLQEVAVEEFWKEIIWFNTA